MTRRITIIAMFMLMSSAIAVASPGSPALKSVIEAALLLNPEQEVPGAIRRQGEAIRRQASSLLADDPALTIRHESDETTDNFGFNSWEGSVQMPLWLPGQRKRRHAVADATELEAESLARFYKWRISGEVRELLWSGRIAQAQVVLARTAVASAQALEADINRRVRAGELAKTDLILARKETLSREIALAKATATLTSLVDEYQLLTGLVELPENILEEERLADTVSAEHPALVAASHSAGRARTERDKVRHEKRSNPVLAMGARNERAASGQPVDTILSLEMSLPLGLRGQSAPAVADAERQFTAEQADYATIKRDVEKQQVLARGERQHAERALELARQHQQLAAEGLRLTQLAFELGESDLFTLLQARTQAFTSDRELQLRQLERGRSIARQNQALGVIPE